MDWTQLTRLAKEVVADNPEIKQQLMEATKNVSASDLANLSGLVESAAPSLARGMPEISGMIEQIGPAAREALEQSDVLSHPVAKQVIRKFKRVTREPTPQSAPSSIQPIVAPEKTTLGIPAVAGIGVGTGAGGYLLGSMGKDSTPQKFKTKKASMNDITMAAFFDELEKIAAATPAAVATAAEAAAAAAEPTLGKLLWKNRGPLALVGLGGVGTAFGAEAYKDWQTGRQMRNQMGN
jgi:hypothetical protein